MKKVKKLLAMVIATVMLMSAMSISSFAGYKIWDSLEAESVAFTDGQSVSFKEVETYYKEYEEYLSVEEDIYGDLMETYPEYFYFNLGYSFFDYTLEVTLNNGKKVEVSTQNGWASLGSVYSLEIYPYISYEEYLRVAESGDDTVKIDVAVSVQNNLFLEYDEESYTEHVAEKEVVDCFVKSISAVSGVPSQFYENSDYYDIDGAKFLVEYADGNKETYTLETEFSPVYFPTYKLNGTEVIIYDNFDEGKFYLQYKDAYYEKDVTYVEAPFESIEITDYVFSEGQVVPDSVTYKITWKDGKEETYTYEPEVEGAVLLSERINAVDGFIVDIQVLPFEIDEDDKINTDILVMDVSVGEVADSEIIESPYAEALGKVNSIADFFVRIVEFFRNIISYIVNMIFTF